MSRTRRTYSLARVILTIGGRQIGGFGSDGGIELEFNAAIAEMSVSADGEYTASYSNDHGITARVTVMSTGKGYRDLAELAQAQYAASLVGSLPSLAFSLTDLNNGDKVTDGQATFTARALPGKGKTASEVTFELFLPTAGATLVHGASIT